MNALTLSVVSHRQGALVADLLADLQALRIDARVILTLNVEEDETFLARFADLRIEVIRNAKPRGFGANHNRALKRCDTPLFVVMNPDLRLREDPFSRIVAAAERFPNAVIFAPRVLDPRGKPEDSVRINLSPWALFKRRVLFDRRPILDCTVVASDSRFRWFAGMFLALRTDAIRALGGFDERFFMYCEDYDLCARAYLSGHQLVFVQEASVEHAARRESHRSVIALAHHIGSLLKVWTSAPVWKISTGARP